MTISYELILLQKTHVPYILLIFQTDSTKSVSVKRWEVIQNALLKEIKSTQELEEAVLLYNPEYAKRWNFEPLHTLFDRVSIIHNLKSHCYFGWI